MSKALETLREALYGTTVIQPISSESKGGSLGIHCRQVVGQEKAWVKLADELLLVAESHSLSIHVCRRYVRKDARMLFCWFIGIEAKSAKALVEAVDLLVPVLARGPEFSRALARAEPTPVKTPVSTYPEPPPKAVIIKAAAQREFQVGDDPVVPAGFKPTLRNIGGGMQEMPLPHTFRDFNKPKPGSTRGAYGGSGIGGGRPKGES